MFFEITCNLLLRKDSEMLESFLSSQTMEPTQSCWLSLIRYIPNMELP